MLSHAVMTGCSFWMCKLEAINLSGLVWARVGAGCVGWWEGCVEGVHRVLGVLHGVQGVLHKVIGVIHRVLGLLHRALGVPEINI